MKPCKGCIHFNNVWLDCSHGVTYTTEYNKYSNSNVKIRHGKNVDLSIMRNDETKCGVNRKLYESSFKWGLIMVIVGILGVLIMGFLMGVFVNILEGIGK